MKDIEVLIVEDSRTQAEAYAEVLREVGYAVTTAPDGRAAIAASRAVTGINMTGKNEFP